MVWALLDSEKGELTGVRYTPTKENSHMVLGDFGDSIICRVRDEEQPLKAQEEEGLLDELGYHSVYSIRSKDDFLKDVESAAIRQDHQ